jgi:hypothetical protein
MGGTCGTSGVEICVQSFVDKSSRRERDHLEDLSIDGRMIL